MSVLSVINTARDTLTAVGGGYSVYIADFLRADSSGELIVPTGADVFILHLITSSPTHEWGSTRFQDARLQVDAWSTTEGEPLAMLNLASSALTAIGFIPFPIVSLGRDNAYTGYAQDFERGTD